MKINLPNLLIVFRILLIPVFLFFFLSAEPVPGEYIFRITALIIFLIASATDFFDGLLARKWNTVSNFGKLMDPLADKMLVSSALIALAHRQELAAWVVVIIICREFWVTALRQLALEQGKAVIAASMWGKVKTVLQIAMLIALMSEPIIGWLLGQAGNVITIVLVYLAVITTVVSGIEYTRDYKDVFKA